jgi:hypothetical protein
VLGLIHDAHAATAELAMDEIVAQPTRLMDRLRHGAAELKIAGDRNLTLGPGLESLHQLQRREELEDPIGLLGATGCVFRRTRMLPAPSPLEVLLGQPFDRIQLRGRWVEFHGDILGGGSTAHACPLNSPWPSYVSRYPGMPLSRSFSLSRARM